jgi:hypothetical protein
MVALVTQINTSMHTRAFRDRSEITDGIPHIACVKSRYQRYLVTIHTLTH